ncbi:MAG: M20/M25/M40 family metallo-hydrolase [Thermoleophilaceae bacterium]|nr:M20/M25/M40 family metallo-hydrolase [Thermoleophilaceae bacterium]
MNRASPDERRRLAEEFATLCEVESPSCSEREVADYVAGELRALGLEVAEDESGAATGSDAGNLLARVPGPEGSRVVLLCAHLDTVPLEAPVQVVERNGGFENANPAILGADNKAAVAVMLAATRRLVRDGSPVGVELLFTTCEERALAGAKSFARDRLRSEWGFVFDHATPIGELMLAAPTFFRIEARFLGHAAHAGIRPEEGRNAIAAAARAIEALELGRLDDETTANVGRIEGGTATNVVAERCDVELEARSLDHGRATAVAHAMVDAITEAAADAECDVETLVEEQFRGYRTARSAPHVQAAAAALGALGIAPSYVASGGGSDANVFEAAGLPCLNVANGTERNHENGERVTREALETTLDLALGIIAASA